MKPRAAALRAIREARGLSLGARLLGVELCLRASEEGAGADAVRVLAQALEVTERTAERWFGELASVGLFERLSRGAWRVLTPAPRSGSDPPNPTDGSGSTRRPDHVQPDTAIGTRHQDPGATIGIHAPRAPGLREPDPEDPELSETSEAFRSEREQACARETENEKPKRKVKNGNGKPKAQTWRFVPDGFEPTEDERAIARERGLDFGAELAKFKDHEFAKPRSDAHRAFRNWLRSAQAYAPRNGGGARVGGSEIRLVDDRVTKRQQEILEQIRREKAERERKEASHG